MASFVLDTTTLTHVRRGHPKVLAAVAQRAATDELIVTTVNVEETLGGWYNLIRKSRTPQAIEYATTELAEAVVVHPGSASTR
jgi:predicted nucleic acid-binding protein